MTARITCSLFAKLASLAAMSLLTACPDAQGSGDTRLLSALSRTEMSSVCSVRVQILADDVIRGAGHIDCVLDQRDRDDKGFVCDQPTLSTCAADLEKNMAATSLEVDCDLDGDNVSHVNSCTTVTVEEWEPCLDALAETLAGFDGATCQTFEELQLEAAQPPAACQAVFTECPALKEINFLRVVDIDGPLREAPSQTTDLHRDPARDPSDFHRDPARDPSDLHRDAR